MRVWYFFSIWPSTSFSTSSGFIPHLKVPALGSPRRTALSLFTSAALAVGAASSCAFLGLPFAKAAEPWRPTTAPRADATRSAPNVLIRSSSWAEFPGRERNLAQSKRQGVTLGEGLAG